MNHSCPSPLISFSSFYNENVDWYLSHAICVAGSVLNIMNIIVFTRKNMVSPTNVVLTSLAVADLALLLSFIPLLQPAEPYSLFRFWSTRLFYLARFISIWITLILAVWRYVAVIHPLKARNWCDMKTTYRTVVAVYVLCSLTTFLEFKLRKSSLPFRKPIKIFFLWSHSIIPVIAMPILTIRLVYGLWKAKKNRQKLMSSVDVQKSAEDLHRENLMDRTTRMLLVVLFLFLIAITPYTLIFLLSYFIENFVSTLYWDCLSNFFPIFMMVVLLDAASNFLVYYFMSTQFGKTCHSLFNNTFTASKNLLPNRANDDGTTETTPV